MKKTLIIVGHPTLDRSIYHTKVINELKHLPNVTIHCLKENFDIKEEQKLLVEHDNIVLQFPVYWYSVPALLKKWIDDVLEYGFAYGEGGDKLEGKTFSALATTASPEDRYAKGGELGFEIQEALLMINAISNYVKGNFIKLVSIHGCIENMPFSISEEDLNIKIKEYKDFITSL